MPPLTRSGSWGACIVKNTRDASSGEIGRRVRATFNSKQAGERSRIADDERLGIGVEGSGVQSRHVRRRSTIRSSVSEGPSVTAVSVSLGLAPLSPSGIAVGDPNRPKVPEARPRPFPATAGPSGSAA